MQSRYSRDLLVHFCKNLSRTALHCCSSDAFFLCTRGVLSSGPLFCLECLGQSHLPHVVDVQDGVYLLQQIAL